MTIRQTHNTTLLLTYLDVGLFEGLVHDALECFVDLVKLLGLLRKLRSEVTSNEDTLQIHPFS